MFDRRMSRRPIQKISVMKAHNDYLRARRIESALCVGKLAGSDSIKHIFWLVSLAEDIAVSE